MWVIGYLGGIIAWLILGQAVILKAFKEPHTWYFGATSQQSKKLKLALKVLLQTTLIGSIFLFPYLIGSTPERYYGPMFDLRKIHYFLYGEGIALFLCALILFIEERLGLLFVKARYPLGKAVGKSALSALSSFTVVGVEEPIFRGIILFNFLLVGLPWFIAIPLSAVLFSAAHFIRKVKTYWPSVGLATLGIWLGVAYYKTGNNLWLPMGLHSGGILAIGIQRCFMNYKGSQYLVGTQTFPIAGSIAIAVMLAGSVITWFLFSGG
jgi:hypothetical protein